MHIYANMHVLTTSIAKKKKKTNLLLFPSPSLIFGAIFVLGSSLVIKNNTQYTYKNEN